jgi:hypothetical protein
MSNINVTVRMDKEKVKELKDIARERSFKEKINISYNDLIISSVYKEYFKEEESEDGE